ncbi:MAG: DUF4115 domain-containing protein [Candidatus Omnitrophica bacterium]|nr:DUF4115 domain-containing protein [Candidatus Omnitrophota bacterium]
MANPPQPNPASESDANAEKGLLLKKIRVERGLPLEAVQEATKIPLDALKAIEEGYTIRSLSPFYYRGFLKMYAQYLGIDGQSVLGDAPKPPAPARLKFERQDFAPPSRFFDIFTRERMRLGVIAGFTLLLIFAAAQLFRSCSLFRSPALKTQSVLSAPVLASQSITPVISGKNKKHRSVEISPVVALQPAAGSVVPEGTNGLAAAAKPKAAVALSERKNIVLTARAKQRCWILVKADGAVVFRESLHTGSAETWVAKERIEITGRNIYQLDFELNGRMLGPLGKKGSRARQVVITREGLTVIK